MRGIADKDRGNAVLEIAYMCDYMPHDSYAEDLEMARIEIYTTPSCPYCLAAKRLLTSKNAAFQETDVSRDPSLREAMMKRANGRRTVPQIFIDGQHIGGSDDLHALDKAGKLDSLLAA